METSTAQPTQGGANGIASVFEITPAGTLTTLYSFFCSPTGCRDGHGPQAGLIQAPDGNLYGTAAIGGANDGHHEGTIFKIAPTGTLTTIYNFCAQSGCTDGTTQGGGADNEGTVFRRSVGFGPFVETQTASGEAGAAGKILGYNLTGATSVTFNGTAATFTVNSAGTAISTTVPTGATTGAVQVVAPSRTLTSNVPFRVT